jgi:hypothetical protein
MRRLSWLVILITALCLVKSTQNIANVWELTIANFCNPDAAAALQVSEWKHYTTSLSVSPRGNPESKVKRSLVLNSFSLL